jgi:2-isopropylmalate synthase
MDFESCDLLAQKAPDDVRVSVLARCHQGDIDKALEIVRHAKLPRLHTFITLSPFHMEYVLNKSLMKLHQLLLKLLNIYLQIYLN